MSRFCFNRKWILGFSALSIVFSGTSLVAPPSSYADTSWADLLKPFVKDVVVPSANAGMKKLIEKKLKLKLDGSSSSYDNYNMTDSSVMSMPEEPTSSSDGADSITSMPEEPTYSASTETSSDASLSEPPPPVQTP